MFLRPHHLQAARQHEHYLATSLTETLHPYAWGCRVVEIDPDALGNSRFVVRRLRARLRDGTIVNLPEDVSLSALDLKPSLERDSRATVYLAVPLAQTGRPNVAESATAAAGGLARYILDTIEIPDENTADDRERLVVRRLNVQLLTSGQDLSGYSVIPLARIRKSARADGRPELEPGYIPPVLACDAWPVLENEILQATYDRVGRKIDILASQVQSRGLVFDSSSQGDALAVVQLRALNEIFTLLGAIAFTPGLHPVTAYIELCRSVGELSVFGPDRRPPAIPRYDHDDLGGCLFKLKVLIDGLLDLFVEPDYKDRPFVGAGLRMEVALEPAWVEAAWQTYIGVQSDLTADELIRVLTQPGVLDMKVGSSERVDGIFRYGREGLRFLPVRNAPHVLPRPGNMTYFQTAADATAEWGAVQKSLTLAIRLNENRIVGSIQGSRDLTVTIDGKTSSLRFTLFVVPRKSLAANELVN